jgi:hypothetical protein
MNHEKGKEFWMAVGVLLVASVALFLGLATFQQWLWLAGPIAGIYVVGRSAIKAIIYYKLGLPCPPENGSLLNGKTQI